VKGQGLDEFHNNDHQWLRTTYEIRRKRGTRFRKDVSLLVSSSLKAEIMNSALAEIKENKFHNFEEVT
jgi:hypothetical protein